MNRQSLGRYRPEPRERGKPCYPIEQKMREIRAVIGILKQHDRLVYPQPGSG